MTRNPSNRRRILSTALLGLGLILPLPACVPQSVMITSVSGKRSLQEVELSRDSYWARDKIAVIEVDGVIMTGSRQRLLGKGERPVSLFVEKLDKARKDPHVKAVLLRIDSPGGSVVASELMYDEIKHFRETGKPIVAMILDVGASGAYYISCACDQILAEPSSVTGSIGVIMQMFDFSGTMAKIGVESNAITSGPYKAAGSPFHAMRADEREIFQSIVNDMYDRFINVVVKGRPKLDEQTVRKLADGRVYSAQQALKVGLIDGITTLRRSIQAVKERAGLDQVRVVAYDRPYGYKPNVYAEAPRTQGGDVNLLSIDVADLMSRAAPRFMYLWQP